MKKIVLLLFTVIIYNVMFASNNDTIFLKKAFNNKITLYNALNNVNQAKSISNENISTEVLSDILWAANGINSIGNNTSYSSFQFNNIDIYVATPKGCYIYIPQKHCIVLVTNNDIREYISNQVQIKESPINLIYISNTKKMTGMFVNSNDQKTLYTSLEVGTMVQNVNLYCAGSNLNVFVSGVINRLLILNNLELNRDEYFVIINQAIGVNK
ncbi:MAG: hypothetical protein A2X12_06080 [Bacteroidetes bacterium GWE2_29_8]|nr:MAG: hypothetical protein A2X12_06080 [Bacteroidetes bacterium GWE2_29_8]OFY20064.1 MAG: hypothetical protein A2X02_06775 [Bacteroidetes bacterium GWF2_29_10]